MINFYFIDLAKLAVAFFVAISQSPLLTASAHGAVLKPGDEMDGMRITTGAARAPSLWAFCSSEEEVHIPTTNCRVPQMTALGIGHVFLPRDHAFSDMDWSALEGQLYIDNKFLVSLDDFGTYNYVLPTVAPTPSIAREVFTKFTAWDVVLTNLQPGTHTIQGMIRAEEEEYRWVVNLVIEARTVSGEKQAKENGSKNDITWCDAQGEWLSHRRHAFQLYG